VGVIAIAPCLDGLEPVYVHSVRVTRQGPMPAHNLEEQQLHAKGPLRSSVLGSIIKGNHEGIKITGWWKRSAL